MASLTIWSRLEPRPREQSMERALQAQVRDPLWMLARQWQVGEFAGDDAGSPISATVRTESMRLTAYQPGTGAVEPFTGAPPLETHVEREPVTPGLRDRLGLGLRFEELLRDEGAGAHAGPFRSAYGIAAAAPADEVTDTAGARMRMAAAGRAPDGEALAAAARAQADLHALPEVAALPTATVQDAAVRALTRLLAYRDALFSVPEGDDSWDGEQLVHGFHARAETTSGTIVLDAPRFGGGHLDWYAFDAATAAAAGTQEVDVRQQSFIPSNVSFRGMPNSRWWAFEDGLTDFGKLDAEPVDLAKLLVMEFALVYGDDWFELPLPLPVGSLSHVDALVVTDTFGERTVLRPTGQLEPEEGEPWSIFSLTGVDPERDLLLLAPTISDVLEGRELEQVLFARDEMAAMGWAVERTLQGPLDAPVDGYELYRARLARTPPPPPRTRTADEPPVEYILGTDVPDNWIPLVPVQLPDGHFRFRRGVMGGPGGHPARGRVLSPGQPYYVAEQAIPREGVQVSRRFRRARWIDGSTYLWMARRAGVGRGEGASGLEFDAVRDVPLRAPAP
jgi:hypothetical protein